MNVKFFSELQALLEKHKVVIMASSEEGKLDQVGFQSLGKKDIREYMTGRCYLTAHDINGIKIGEKKKAEENN